MDAIASVIPSLKIAGVVRQFAEDIEVSAVTELPTFGSDFFVDPSKTVGNAVSFQHAGGVTVNRHKTDGDHGTWLGNIARRR